MEPIDEKQINHVVKDLLIWDYSDNMLFYKLV